MDKMEAISLRNVKIGLQTKEHLSNRRRVVTTLYTFPAASEFISTFTFWEEGSVPAVTWLFRHADVCVGSKSKAFRLVTV